MRPFDVEKMFAVSKRAIDDFAKDHTKETFYAFSIDANLLCLNSLEKFEEQLRKYQQKYPQHYSSPDSIKSLQYNTGDWAYQGFFELSDEDGFNSDLYNEHYDIPSKLGVYEGLELEKAFSCTPYHLAMEALLKKLMEAKVFDQLKKTPDFKAFLSEHNY